MTDNGDERLGRNLRRWAKRPTFLSPQAARTRVVAHLPSRRRQPTWRLVAGGGALTATALAVALIIGRPSEPVTGPPQPTVASSQRMIVHELSSGTKLYIVVRPGAAGDES
jgi:hypothetical protein